MSSVWNHVPSRSMVFSLRAAHPGSRSIQKGYCFRTSFHPTYPKLVDNAFSSPASLFPRDATETAASIERGPRPGKRSGLIHDDNLPSINNIPGRPRLQSPINPFPPQTHPMRPGEPQVANELRENEAGEPSSHGVHASLEDQFHSDPSFSSPMTPPKRSSYSDPSPSEFLIDTLQNLALSSEDTKVKVKNWTVVDGNNQTTLMDPLSLKQRFKFKRLHRVSLQEIIADYIQFVDPVLQKRGEQAIINNPRAASEFEYAIRSMLREDYTQYLTARQYDITDVMTWAWVLKSSTPYEAVIRMIMLEADQRTVKSRTSSRVPPFIPLLLLRQTLDLKTFRLLLIYSLHLISGLPIPPLNVSLDDVSSGTVYNMDYTCNKRKPSVDSNMCVTYVVRLLHHSRLLWPEAQLTIARAFTFYLSTLKTKGGSSTTATDRIVSFMVDKFNTCLRLLSLPCKIRPFASVSIQQQAQFELLKAMANHRPVLPVTRKGYQGLIAVQLAHKKTSAERQSAELKAPSWPPWKEEKLGIDFQRGVEGMKSRAIRVMSQMKEAGYAHSRWEEVSSILAGWDTDNSPTIQTRALVRRPENLHGPAGRADHHAVWEARIRATRTVREAWACFLAHENQGLPPHVTIYAAMAEKIIFRHRAVKKSFDDNSRSLPGDGLEVFPEPSSVRDWIYTSTEPPTLDDLIKKMLSQEIRPRGRFLALLLRNAPTFSSGLEYLNSSDLTEQQIKSLWTARGTNVEPDPEVRKALDEFPDYLFSAFIHFLCRFSTIKGSSIVRGDLKTADIFPIVSGSWLRHSLETTALFTNDENARMVRWPRHRKTLAHAIHLLRSRNSQCPQGWIQLLSALGAERIHHTSTNTASKEAQKILAWYEILEVLEWTKERCVEIGFEGFHVLCFSFSKAVAAGAGSPVAMEEALQFVNAAIQRENTHFSFASPGLEDMVRSGLTTLKSHFDRLVIVDANTTSLFEPIKASLERGTDSQVTLPALLRVPPPAILHAFVRSLGLAEDSDGLLSLLRWMSEHASTLQDTSDEYLNGDRMMRRTLVATRTFLEGYWRRQFWGDVHEPVFASQVTLNGDDDVPTFSDPDLQLAYDIVTANPVWGPWPSDEEVSEYMAYGKR